MSIQIETGLVVGIPKMLKKEWWGVRDGGAKDQGPLADQVSQGRRAPVPCGSRLSER